MNPELKAFLTEHKGAVAILALIGVIITAICTFSGVLLTGYFTTQAGAAAAKRLEIEATQTGVAIAKLTAEAPEVVITLSSVVPPTQTPVSEPTATNVPSNEDDDEKREEVPPTSTPIVPTATPQAISVWSIEENGVRVNIDTPGIYNVAYLGDAYSPWPHEDYTDYQGWTTILRIYVNSSVRWGMTEYDLEGPIDHDDYLGPGGYYLDKEDAIASSKGDSRTMRLNKGDYLTLVTLDQRGRYSDNRGKIDVGITYLGQ